MRDVIQRVMEAEGEARRLIEEAEAEAQQIVAEARRQAEAARDAARTAAREEAAQLVAEAEAEAEREKRARLADAARRLEAEVNLDDAHREAAVQAVLRIVCGGDP